MPKQKPFRDTQDPEVLKAYGLGFVTGLTEDTFGGEEPVTREQAAVMLTVVYQYRNEDNRKAFLLWVALYGRDNDLNDDSNLTEQQASNMLAGTTISWILSSARWGPRSSRTTARSLTGRRTASILWRRTGSSPA